MASAIQPCVLGVLLSKIHGQLKAEPTKPGLKELALKTLAQVEAQRSSWCEVESQEFYSTYSGIVEDLTKLTVKAEAVVEVKYSEQPIVWRKGAEWPALTFYQPHPEYKLLHILGEINGKYAEFKSKLEQDAGISGELVYNHDWDKPTEEDQPANSLFSKNFYDLCRFFNQNLPPETVGFGKALKYVQNFMRDKKLVDFNKDQVLLLIREVEAHLVGQKTPYRKTDCFIFNTLKVNKNKASFTALDKYFSGRKVACPEDFALWTTLRGKLWNHKYKLIPMPFGPTEAEIGLMERSGIGRLPPPPHEIRGLMDQFAKDLCQKFQTAEDPFALMAWMHKEYVRIHPFADANGRGARILMALIGMQAGIPPVIIDNDANYERAVTNPGISAFADYLRSLHEEQASAPLCSAFIQDVLAGIVKDSP